MYSNIEYTVPSFVGLVVVLYTAPWHFKTGNIATLSMIFWMMVQNIVHLVNGKRDLPLTSMSLHILSNNEDHTLTCHRFRVVQQHQGSRSLLG